MVRKDIEKWKTITDTSRKLFTFFVEWDIIFSFWIISIKCLNKVMTVALSDEISVWNLIEIKQHGIFKEHSYMVLPILNFISS